ncbi:MAG: pyruvate ferredoxin oxidoreductase [Clostridiales bacterium]|jgi:pyruvate ferredoxin oxidoreductase alpha subunit|nr:pyruvate ferredoxin oxidoreductase [Clostridiales bacterium]
MARRDRMSGNEAVAFALKQINPDVFPMFPITPSTEIPQYFSNYVANGEVDTEFITVESEHSSMTATIAASSAGARALTATSSAGLAFMWEMLHIAAANRNPIVLALVNRALSGPLNINGDHSDGMGARDTGWVQLYAEDNQEVYDNMVMAYRISEHKDLHMPIMICQDGFITSHAVQNIELIDDDKVKNFVGEYEPEDWLLNPSESIAFGSYSVADYYIEAKKAMSDALSYAPAVVKEISDEFAELTGRSYDLVESYMLDDADFAIVAIGSVCGTTKCVIDSLRNQGIKAGLAKIRMYRPFPAKELCDALVNVKGIAILDRAEGMSGQGGPLGADVMSALFREKSDALAVNYIYGLGGRDVKTTDILKVYDDLKEIVRTGDDSDAYRYLGIRE